MEPKASETRRASARNGKLLRQLVFSAVALGIMAVGIWSLMNMRAPYHPDEYSNVESHEDAVSRDNTNLWLGVPTAD